jgi:F-type H+-transporting ATPase subunit delta
VRITTLQYAQALYELTKDKPENEVSIVIEKYVANLKRQGLLNRAESIIKKFTEIYNKENGIVKAKVFTSREMDESSVQEIAKVIKEKYAAEEVELEMTVDKKLKGGIKIVVGEEILDNSIAGRLTSLRTILAG